MKKSELNPVCIYRNAEHEEATKKELAAAQNSLQAVLEVWKELDLVPCKDIHALIMNPQKIYSTTVEELAVVPVQAGRFQVSKQAYISTLDIPIPDSLYRACKSARTHSYCGIPELWSIDSDRVVLNASEAGNLIDSQSIYTNDPKQIEFCKDLDTFVKLFGKLNASLKGQLSQPTPMTYEFCRGKFEVREAINNSFEIVIAPAILRKWLAEIVK